MKQFILYRENGRSIGEAQPVSEDIYPFVESNSEHAEGPLPQDLTVGQSCTRKMKLDNGGTVVFTLERIKDKRWRPDNTYKFMIDWIARNDEPTVTDPEALSGLATVAMLADLSKRDQLLVAKDVVALRKAK